MAKYLRNFLVVVAFFALIIFILSHIVMWHLTQSGKLKEMSEKYLAQLLNSEVKISKIEPYFFHKVKISGVEVKLSEKNAPFWIHVNEVVLDYNLLQLFSNKAKSPTAIEFATPSLKLNHQDVFKELNSPNVGYLSAFLLSQVNLVGGKLDYYLPSFNKTLHFKDVKIHSVPSGDKKIHIEMSGISEGFFNSMINIKGYWDLEKQNYSFEVFIAEGHFDVDVADRLQEIEGHFTLTDNHVSFDRVKASSNGWSFESSGEIQDINTSPYSKILIQIGKASDAILSLRLEHHLRNQWIEGDVVIPGSDKVPFSGKLITENDRILLNEVKGGLDYQGKGEFNFKTGDYFLRFNNELQRFLIRSNLNGDEVFLDLDLNHYKVFDLDLVALASLRFWPSENKEVGEAWKLRGQLTSQYFIVEQQPLENFEGTFLVDSQGIEDLRTTWGESFEMNGDIFMKEGKADAQLAVRVVDFNLKRLKDLLRRPLPKDILGQLNGKLKIDGKLSKPEVLGQFTIREGSISKLDFDRMMIQVRGFPPYLKLNDSRIIKGRTKFHLVGAFDLSLDNPLHGVHVETADKVIVWKGFGLSTNQESRSLDFETALPGLGKLAMDLNIDSGKDQHRFGDELEDENLVALKPKIKF